jgi:hypothetical protein
VTRARMGLAMTGAVLLAVGLTACTSGRTATAVAPFASGQTTSSSTGYMPGTTGFQPTSVEPPVGSPLAGLQTLPCPAATVSVSDSGQLQDALDAARPGTVIHVADGVYQGRFYASASGTPSRPVWLCGDRQAIIDAQSAGTYPSQPRPAEPYGLYLVGASWWRIVGLSVRNGQKGIVVDHSDHDVLHGLTVYNIGDEGIHLRDFSSDDTVEGTTVRGTGLLTAKYGEGIYVGTAVNDWGRYSDGRPDGSDDDIVQYNDLALTTAENIDIKEGTSGGYIASNRLDGTDMVASAAHSWVNVKGNSYTVSGNTGRISLGDGFSTHVVVPGDGQGNRFSSNHIGPGVRAYGFDLEIGNFLSCDNTGAGRAGRSNFPCTS